MYGVIFIAMGWLKLVAGRPPLLSTSTPFWRSRPHFGGRQPHFVRKNIYQKKVLISQIRGHGEHREACPVIFSNLSIFNRTLKMACHEGFAGGLKK